MDTPSAAANASAADAHSQAREKYGRPGENTAASFA